MKHELDQRFFLKLKIIALSLVVVIEVIALLYLFKYC